MHMTYILDTCIRAYHAAIDSDFDRHSFYSYCLFWLLGANKPLSYHSSILIIIVIIVIELIITANIYIITIALLL